MGKRRHETFPSLGEGLRRYAPIQPAAARFLILVAGLPTISSWATLNRAGAALFPSAVRVNMATDVSEHGDIHDK
jgi:hypothetical protein